VVFNSFSFVVFFGAVLALHNTPLPWPVRKAVLFLASAVFYAAWNPVFLLLLAASVVTDWFVAGNIARTGDVHRRRAWLALSLTTNLGLLAVFKYGNFFAGNFETLAAWAGAPVSLPRVTLPLPVGISFYTFEALAYSIDVFRRRAEPWTRFRDFGLFLTFFPHLVAGPIVRPADFRPQLEAPRRTRWPQLSWGLALLIFGLFQKVVLADALLAPVTDAVFAGDAHAGTGEAWIGALAFSGQIFCDFSGYTLCAIGAALALGFALPDNFNSPYGAAGLTDFWRRWHVSLSSWLRDYLYIPLGGNHGSAARVALNLMITMVLGGLWHGASWTFLAWGGLHGTLLVAERGIKAAWQRASLAAPGVALRAAITALTFVLVTVAWVFFRSPDFATAFRLLASMAGSPPAGAASHLLTARWQAAGGAGIPLVLAFAHARCRTRTLQDLVDRWPSFARAAVLGLMLTALALFTRDGRAFIYFQF
jgi:alginate O-acetyltransferase complex protein AlgI